MKNLISWKPIYFHLSLQSGVQAFVLTTTEHSNIENSLPKKPCHEEDEHKGAFNLFNTFLALVLVYCLHFLIVLILTWLSSAGGKGNTERPTCVKSPSQK